MGSVGLKLHSSWKIGLFFIAITHFMFCVNQIREMLPRIESSQRNPAALVDLFSFANLHLKNLYVTYCKGQQKSESIIRDFTEYIKVSTIHVHIHVHIHALLVWCYGSLYQLIICVVTFLLTGIEQQAERSTQFKRLLDSSNTTNNEIQFTTKECSWLQY